MVSNISISFKAILFKKSNVFCKFLFIFFPLLIKILAILIAIVVKSFKNQRNKFQAGL